MNVNEAILNADPNRLRRPAGSTLDGVDVQDGEAVQTFLAGLAWEDVTKEIREMGAAFGACTYFRAGLTDGVSGWEGVALLSELSDEVIALVRVQRGHHGNLELVLPGLQPRPTNLVHLIRAEDGTVITWFPGRITEVVALEGATVKRV